MTYARTDDNYYESPEIAALSDKAFRAHFKGWGYCARNLSDGFVPASVASAYGAKAVAELVEAKEWAPAGGGFLILHFLDHNDSRETVMARRQKDSARKRGDVVPDGIRMESARIPGEERIGEVLGLEVQEPQPRYEVLFEQFWESYPRKVGKATARAAFKRALERYPGEKIAAAAIWLANDPNLPTDRSMIPHPTTWLNRDGWLDEPYPERNGSLGPEAIAEFLRSAK